MEKKIISLIINSDIQGLIDLSSELEEKSNFNKKTVEEQIKIANALKAAELTNSEEYSETLKFIEELSDGIAGADTLLSRIQNAIKELQ